MKTDDRFVPVNAMAVRSTHQRFAVADAALLDALAERSRSNARQREILTFHHHGAEPLHRMLNAMQPGTYVRAHRHLDPPKAESFMLLRGLAGFAIYEDDGGLPDENLVLLDLDRQQYAIDIREGVWHAVVALAPDTLLFEVKPGPYAATTDKDFAPWSPAADDPAAATWQRLLEERFRQRFALPFV